jgi:hypothetical protein
MRLVSLHGSVHISARVERALAPCSQRCDDLLEMYRYTTPEVPASADEFAAASETNATDAPLPPIWPMVLHFVSTCVSSRLDHAVTPDAGFFHSFSRTAFVDQTFIR